MSSYQLPTSAVTRYESVLRNYRKSRLPDGVAMPQPPSAWPAENAALFEHYLLWLVADGAGVTCICNYYLPMAGHVFGFHLHSHTKLDLDADLEKAMAFVRRSNPSVRWLLLCTHALNRFRRFMHEERGVCVQPTFSEPVDVHRYQEGLPTWLVNLLQQYQHLRQANWRPARLNHAIRRFWRSHTAVWGYLFAHYALDSVGDIKRQYLYAFMDDRLATGVCAQTVNVELRSFQATLRFLQEQEFAIPQALLRLPGLKEADRLPRFLTDEQVRLLRNEFAQQVADAKNGIDKRNALLNQATFYLLWQGGLRLGEVEELTIADLNLSQQQLIVRQGKGLHDRAVYLTEIAVTALQDYLAVRGEGAYDHVFLYRHQPLSKDFVRGRLHVAGKHTGVKVTPHQLRHTYATQLLNAGCKITTIQALLGHQRLNTTMIYARVHDQTVAEDYFAAMVKVEKRLEAHLQPAPKPKPDADEQALDEESSTIPLLTLLDALQAEPLSGEQQALLAVLRHNIEALTQTQEPIPNPPE